ncbi:hypothetical protein DL89DRAFT_137346 [Linderina pennispora]|uniref:Uncharacterized protein n=1 Tax=Linderina pennispora TaxID=61395 RepID=A0A1Y1WBH2_9FUNG|nr:uncharacterized protein DL89DRAFT_137346 [Linderina pennispora]ORX70668.1 hypothetical protein DL89DRAFT_137346 [Linderina pennispora]
MLLIFMYFRIRSRSSPAALLVNVITMIFVGDTPRLIISMTRAHSVLVLPDPAPAMISSGLSMSSFETNSWRSSSRIRSAGLSYGFASAGAVSVSSTPSLPSAMSEPDGTMVTPSISSASAWQHPNCRLALLAG